MMDTLLTTRYRLPALRPKMVGRTRLIERLNESLQLDHRLFLVAAPAGFGKTTLLVEWAAAVELPVAWLSCDNHDHDVFNFLKYLFAALRQVDESIGRTSLPLLASSSQPIALDPLMASLVNDLSQVEGGLLLVLDDYHAISSFAVHDLVSFLLDNRPPGFFLAVGSREDPPLPLARLRARGQITEIRERSLRFTSGECATFLSRTMNLALSPEAVQALENRTEGWVTGLQLASLAIRNETQVEQFITNFAGDDRYIMDYLFGEVLNREAESLRQFLYQTSVLERLTGPLCVALTGREDSQIVLEGLEKANLFLLPLDNRREWYRYHRLFAEALRLSLDSAEQQRLHRQAMGWYEQNGYPDEAIDHALAYARLSGDLDDAERVIGRAALEGIVSGSTNAVSGWLSALPEERLENNPDLALGKAWLLAINGDSPGAKGYLDAAASGLQSKASPAEKGRLLVLRGFIALMADGAYDQAIQLTTKALEQLPLNWAPWRVIALWVKGEALERAGPISTAIETFAQAQKASQNAGTQVFRVTVEMALTAALNNNGRRRHALAICREALARYQDKLGRYAPLSGLLLSQMGLLYHEANELEKAQAFHRLAMEAARQLGEPGYLLAVQGFSALTEAAVGNFDEAIELLQEAELLARQTGLADPQWYQAQIANICLGRGEVAAAVHWAEIAGISPDDNPHYLGLDIFLAYARLLRCSGQPVEAGRLLNKLEKFTIERELNRHLLAVLCQQSFLAGQRNQPQVALAYLEQALQLVGQEDYFRLFLEEQAWTVEQLVASRPVNPRFVDQLLVFSRGPAVARALGSQPLVEPLSQRELEVLDLIVEGLSNAEIAQHLYIALGTVKRHINNIYGKLEVGSRTQAVAKARTLDLLGPTT